MPSAVILEPKSRHTASLIFLHGLGDTGNGWASAMGSVRPPNVKVICPTAPIIPVSINHGFEMTSWFDLHVLDQGGPEDEEGVKLAAEFVQDLIRNEMGAGLTPARIVLGGFSQGGALALYAGLTLSEKLAGIVALSCWLPLPQSFPGVVKCPKDVEVLQCHGDRDPTVPYSWGVASGDKLKTFLTRHQFKTFEGLGHSSSRGEMDLVKEFLHGKLGE